jgi:hypothetical protein
MNVDTSGCSPMRAPALDHMEMVTDIVERTFRTHSALKVSMGLSLKSPSLAKN